MGAGASSDRVQELQDRILQKALQKKADNVNYMRDPFEVDEIKQQVQECLQHVRSLKQNLAGGVDPKSEKIKEHLAAFREALNAQTPKNKSLHEVSTLSITTPHPSAPTTIVDNIQSPRFTTLSPSVEQKALESFTPEVNQNLASPSTEKLCFTLAKEFEQLKDEEKSKKDQIMNVGELSREGISLTSLRNFVAEESAKLHGKTTRSICDEIIKPTTAAINCSYVELIKSKSERKKAGIASVFVSHAWDCKFSDLVDCIFQWAAENNLSEDGSCNMWIDLFSVNQNVEVTATVNWQSQIRDIVAQTDNALIVISLMDRPIWFSRVWCLYELYLLALCGRKKHFICPPKQMDDLVKNLKDKAAIFDMFGEIDVNKAEAWHKSDEVLIKKEISTTVGCSSMNETVVMELREWFVPLAKQVHTTMSQAEKGSCYLPLKLAEILRDCGRFEEALEIQNERLSAQISILGHEHEDVVETKENIALLMENLGRFDDAISILEAVLEVRLRVAGPRDVAVASTLKNIGVVLDSQSRYDEALVKYEEALEIERAVLGNSNSSVANTLNNMGLVYDKLGLLYEALKVYEEAYDIYWPILGKSHVSIADAMNNIGNVYEQLGRYDDALSKHQQALEIKRAVLGEKHASVADTENNIGSVLMNMGGRQEEAILHLKAAHKVYVETYGSAHPCVATTLMNIGAVYREQGRTTDALFVYGEALAIQRAAVGEAHADMALTLEHMAFLSKSTGDLDKARQLYLEAHQIYLDRFGPMHPSTQRAARAFTN